MHRKICVHVCQEAIAEGGLLEDLTLRQSLLVAVGDLLFRHPNVVEPWWGCPV